MNLAYVIKRKGKSERLLDELTEALKSSIDKYTLPFEGRPNNAETMRDIQRTVERAARDYREIFAPLERVFVDVTLRDDGGLNFNPPDIPRPGVYTGW